MFVLVLLSSVLCLTALLYLVCYKHINFKHALSFTVVLLVASIPIAIEIVCTTTLSLGARMLSKCAGAAGGQARAPARGPVPSRA